MRYVKRDEFLQMPAGTVYMRRRANVYDLSVALEVKTSAPSDGWSNDWVYADLVDADSDCDNLIEAYKDLIDNGVEMPVSSEETRRDGGFDTPEELGFLVLSDEDVETLIVALGQTLR